MSDTTIKHPVKLPARRASVPCVRIVFTQHAATIGAWEVIAPGTTRVGRAPESHLRLMDPRVSRRHAELVHTPEAGLRIVDASANGVYVNGARVVDQVLADGDIFRLGDTIFIARYRDPDEPVELPLPGCIGDSPAACAMYRTVRKAARAQASVLVIGESGTGKELVARAIHELGNPGTPFIPVNCAAIAETLAESALFGHVAGAFTGASKPHAGYFRAADGGVLFLDEVGELASAIQAKLLRVLEEHEVTPLGGDRPIACHARVVAATNKDLHAAALSGAFRGDLYARLAEVIIATPTLRERREDIMPLLRDALGAAPPMTAELCEALLLYPWPFNVRELRKLAVDLRVRGEGQEVLDLDLVQNRLKTASDSTARPAHAAPSEQRDSPPDRGELERLLRDHHGSIADVARATGRSRKQVYRWLEIHGVDPDAFRSG
ncbi:MAG TPA: sigma 54-interacting transcriptional regulator [Kofleriaceae bacterium]